MFNFNSYPGSSLQVNRIIEKLLSEIEIVISSGTASEWMKSQVYNDGLVMSVFKDSGLTREQLNRFMNRNLEGLKAFQVRQVTGLNLSERVWNLTFKSDIELAISAAIGEGKSAASLAVDVKRMLNNPDMLFRRVRDKWGELQLSKAAANYHPGQGVYRSSYKNAMRLTRSEINMAYRQADYERWKELPFVIGYEVALSNAHRVTDICDELKGRYPKEFKFVGWHPLCLCHVLPILCSNGDLNKMTDQILRGEEPTTPESAGTIDSPPDSFMSWIEKNKEKIQGWDSQPYFIRDNFNSGDVAKGLKTDIKGIQNK